MTTTSQQWLKGTMTIRDVVWIIILLIGGFTTYFTTTSDTYAAIALNKAEQEKHVEVQSVQFKYIFDELKEIKSNQIKINAELKEERQNSTNLVIKVETLLNLLNKSKDE